MPGFAARLRSLRLAAGLRQQDISLALGIAQTTVANYENGHRFPDEKTLGRIADVLSTSLDDLLGRPLGVRRGVSPAAAQGTYLAGPSEQYFQVLRGQGRRAAFDLVRTTLSPGSTVAALYREVLTPALREVGRLWALGEMEVGEEHAFSEATQTVMAQRYPTQDAPAPRRGTRCCAFSACGEPHLIGLRMVADILELEGWDTLFMGAGLCGEHAMKALRKESPHLLALSVTVSHNVGFARELIASIHFDDALRRMKILVGGQAFLENPGLWKEIGADATASGPAEAALVAARLVRPRSSRR
jgi:MerR family transcriptional regulator, light-induced transcriptional regulator